MVEKRSLIDDIERIVALSDAPILRNLLITQCYHDLSSELARKLPGHDVNWCTFATWASKTAGRFIRNEEVPALLDKLLSDSRGALKSAERLHEALLSRGAQSPLGAPSLRGLATRILKDVSDQITLGNLAVFSELAPVFARFVASVEDGRPNQDQVQTLLDSLRVGPSSENGQSLLRKAMEHLNQAALEADPVRKAQHRFLANALTGLHEQIRLQPYIAGSLNAPIEDILGKIWSQTPQAQADPAWLAGVHALWEGLGAALVHEVERVWDAFAAAELMTLAVPGQVLHLGSRLPKIPGRPLYPQDLERPVLEDVRILLEQYDAIDPEQRGEVGASDWTSLAQRMRYILALFRSRQQDSSLYGEPFSDAQHTAILNGEVPPGPLS